MSLFSVIVDIAARTGSIEQGVKKSGDLLEKFGEQTKRVGETLKHALEFAGIATSIGEVVHLFDEFTEHAESMKLAAQQTGLAVEQFSRLEFAAKQTGVASDQLSAGLKIFARYATEAAGGSQTYVETFKALGVAVTDAQGNMRPMSDLLADVADKFSTYQDGTAKAALAQQLFGRSGAELIPLLDQGSKGIKQFGDRFDALGGTITKTTAEGAEKFRQKMDEVHAMMGGVENVIMANLLPALTNLLDGFTNSAAGAGGLNNKLEPLVFMLKEVVQWAYVTEHTFEDVGDALGGLSAVIALAATGHFKQAKSAWDDWQQHSQDRENEGNEFLKKLWSDAGSSLDKLADKADQDTKKIAAPIVQLGRGMHAVKSMADEMSASFEKLAESTNALVSRRSDSLTNSVAASNARQITQQHDQWIKSQQDMVDSTKKSTDQMTTFADQAARNIQSSFAKFLFDPFHGGMKGMLVSFINTIRQMLAQAAAAQILKALFGQAGSGGNGQSGLGGIFGSLLSGMSGGNGASGSAGSAIGSMIAGMFADGGYATAGKSYLVGEQGPEIFTPGAGGYVTPNGAGTGHLSYNPTFHIDARGADADRIMTVLPPVMQQMIAQSKYDLLQAFRRSGLPAPLRA